MSALWDVYNSIVEELSEAELALERAEAAMATVLAVLPRDISALAVQEADLMRARHRVEKLVVKHQKCRAKLFTPPAPVKDHPNVA